MNRIRITLSSLNVKNLEKGLSAFFFCPKKQDFFCFFCHAIAAFFVFQFSFISLSLYFLSSPRLWFFHSFFCSLRCADQAMQRSTLEGQRSRSSANQEDEVSYCCCLFFFPFFSRSHWCFSASLCASRLVVKVPTPGIASKYVLSILLQFSPLICFFAPRCVSTSV